MRGVERRLHGKSLWWPVVARNKKAITLDLRQAEGQELLKALVSKADFLLENFRPGTMEKWGLGWDELSAHQSTPDHDPRVRLRADRALFEAGRVRRDRRGHGRAALRRWRPEAPRPRAWGSRSATRWLRRSPASARSSALHHRDQTGRGQVVDSAIYEAVLNMMESVVTEYDKAGYIRERTGAILPNVAPSNVYRTRDGLVLIAANQDTVFQRLAEAMGSPNLRQIHVMRRRGTRRQPSGARRARRKLDTDV